MTYDRDEWRRPWRPHDTPVSASGVRALSGDEASEIGSVEDTGAPTPIARFPQPPPSAWDESSEGPGSPAGSVRPPDTTGTVDAPVRPRRGPRLLSVALVAFLSAVLGVVGTLLVLGPDAVDVPAEPAPANGPVSAPTIEVEGGGPSLVPAVAQAVAPSVVQINVAGAGTGGLGESVGSGVIYRSDGYIITNNHVVENSEDVRVRLSNGDVLDGEVVGTDPLNDLAVIRVDRDGLPAINVRGEDEPLLVGETVVAIGSPFGLDGSVTSGIVSGLNREIAVDVDEATGTPLVIPSVIQTDAAINPGNSGGALVDHQGRLIGINTAILTRTGGSQGVGFAVPAGQAITSADQLIEQGFVNHPLLGITGQDVTPEIAEEFGLETPRGAIIESVQPDTGAADAGLQAGDIIVQLDGESIATMSEVVAEVRRRQPGDTLEIVVVRNGERITASATLGERPRD